MRPGGKQGDRIIVAVAGGSEYDSVLPHSVFLCCTEHPFICHMSNSRLQHMHFFHYFTPISCL